MNRDNEILACIVKAHTDFVEESDPRKLFEGFLKIFLSLTESEYGFIGEVLHQENGEPYLKTFAITNISWNDETRDFYEKNAPEGLEFYNLKTLFGHVMVHEETVIANQPAKDPRSGGIPEGHPSLDAFLGLPIISNGQMVGMAGLANKTGGYSTEEVELLRPLLLTCGNYIRLLWDEREAGIAQAALLESEVRSNAILDSSLDVIITINEKGFIVSANQAVKKHFGYSIDEVVGQKINMLMPEPHRSQHDLYLQRYLETGKAHVIGIGREALGQRKDGSRFPIELAVTESSIPGKYLFTGVIRDISERKIAENDLEVARRQLVEANESMLAILNESRTGVLMTNNEGHIQFVNQSLENYLHRDEKALLNKHWESALRLTQANKAEVRNQFDLQQDLRSRVSIKLDRGREGVFWGEIEVCDDPRDADGKILFVYDVSEINRLRMQLSASATRQMLGKSYKMQELFASLNKVSAGDWTVLVQGETGTGKELVAKAIHAASKRRNGPFVAVNCGGLTESLLTSQLFGCRRGAFTGATADQEGFFEAANGGTLFLDEIGDVPLDVQTAMLRVLEEREVTRVGETKPRKIDVRVLAATNRDLNDEVNAGRFRKDLLYRIEVARIYVPALRDRIDDLPLLVNAFLNEAQAEVGKLIRGVDQSAMQMLCSYTWPGNVRELKNVIDAAVINCDTDIVSLKDLPHRITKSPERLKQATDYGDVREVEIEEALRRARGNRSKAAKLMGVSRATFYRRLVDAGIETRKK